MRSSPEAQFFNADCMGALRRVESESATLILTDPPFGIGYKDQSGNRILNDALPFIWWMHEAFRITRKGGSLLCFCRWDVQEVFRVAMQTAGFRVRSQVIWNRKHHGMGDCRAQFAPQHEVIWFATKGRFSFPAGRPKSILSVAAVPPGARTHPAEKPVSLLRELIEATTVPGELVLDPCAGTGATGVASIESGRRYLGCELDPAHARVTRSRIRRAKRSAA